MIIFKYEKLINIAKGGIFLKSMGWLRGPISAGALRSPLRKRHLEPDVCFPALSALPSFTAREYSYFLQHDV